MHHESKLMTEVELFFYQASTSLNVAEKKYKRAEKGIFRYIYFFFHPPRAFNIYNIESLT